MTAMRHMVHMTHPGGVKLQAPGNAKRVTRVGRDRPHDQSTLAKLRDKGRCERSFLFSNGNKLPRLNALHKGIKHAAGFMDDFSGVAA
jgi:hypothetical protein